MTSRALGFDGGEVLLAVDDLSVGGPDRAIEAAVGAVSELLLAFFAIVLAFDDSVESVAFAERGAFEWLTGDLTELEAVLAEDVLVEIAAGLPLVSGFFAVDLCAE